MTAGGGTIKADAVGGGLVVTVAHPLLCALRTRQRSCRNGTKP